MALFAFRPALPFRTTLRRHALASALLALGGSVAAAAGLPPQPQPRTALRVQYRPDPYGQYQPDPYGRDQYRPDPRQDPRGYEDQRDGYGRDRYGPGRRGYDDRGDRYGQDGGGRGGSYQRSCEAIRQDGPILSAVCGDGRGHRFESSINVSRCGRSDIGNSRGILQCGNIRGDGRRVD